MLVSLMRETMQSLHSTSLALAHLVLLISLPSPTSCCTEKEKGPLLQFLDGLSRQRHGGGLAASWLESKDCCTWEGIVCNINGRASPPSSVTHVSLASRSLEGNIPASLANLTYLEELDLSNNRLTGAIPGALNRLHFLAKFNVSNNDLEGPVPSGSQFDAFPMSSFLGNPKLCGIVLNIRCGSASKPPVSSRKQGNTKAVVALALAVFCGCLALLFLLGSVLVSTRRNGKNTELNGGDVSEQRSLDVEVIGMPNCKFVDILEATSNFDKDNIIGCGGCGFVYKAELPGGRKLAIKKLHGEMCLTEREFVAEIDALTMAHQENLVPLWGYCIKGNSSFLIYSFRENGSLADWLHGRDENLDWPTRLKIAQGASRGLSYIHHVCKPHIVHRDIKSSNILLDKEFKAYVADFGLARLMLPNQTHFSTELAGSVGYIPPEYGQSSLATLRGDVYSFGVVLLELLTGRRPFEVSSTQELVPWVRQMWSREKEVQVLDPTLRGRGYEEQMLKVLEVACKCVDYSSFKRPTMMQVVSCLDTIEADLSTTQKLAMHNAMSSMQISLPAVQSTTVL